MLSTTVWTGTNRVSLCLASMLTSSWITLTSLISFSQTILKTYSTTAIKSEWALWPLMQLHITAFTRFMAQTSSLTCSVLKGAACSLLVPMQSPKEQVCRPFLVLGFFFPILGERCFSISWFNPSHVDAVKWKWAVLPLRPLIGLREIAELNHQNAVFLPKTQLCFWLTYSNLLPAWHLLRQKQTN